MSKQQLDIIQTKGGQMFTVPNGVIGREFIRLLRVYIADSYKIRTRGRAKNRKAKGGNGQDTPRTTSDWLAVYVERNGLLNIAYQKNMAWRTGYESGLRFRAIDERERLSNRIQLLNKEIGDSL